MLPRVAEGEGGRDCVCHMWEVFGVATGKLHTHTQTHTPLYVLWQAEARTQFSLQLQLRTWFVPHSEAVKQRRRQWQWQVAVAGCTVAWLCLIDGFPAAATIALKCSSLTPHTTQYFSPPLFALFCPSFTCSAGRTGLPGSAWTVVKAILCCISNVLQNIYLFALCLCFVFFLRCFLHSLWLKVHCAKWRLSWNWTLCMLPSLLSVLDSEIFFIFLFSGKITPPFLWVHCSVVLFYIKVRV